MPEQSDYDILGTAIKDYLSGNGDEDIVVRSDFGAVEMYPVTRFFRTYNELPAIERKALRLCEGKVLDVGAGAGVHSLILDHAGYKVTALDHSPGCAYTMRKLGVPRVRQTDFFELEGERYDTLLLLMNGIGIVGTFNQLPDFFRKSYELLFPGGQILFDSSDISYMFEEEDGSVREERNRAYFGEVRFQMSYKGFTGPEFPWLYVRFEDVKPVAEQYGFKAELIYQKEDGHYLAKFLVV